MDPSSLVLRDVHLPPSPSWWPPAPGWWGVAGIAIVLLAAAIAWGWRRRNRRRRWLELFEQACRQSGSAAQVAALSELLRRAARRVDPTADRLQGEAWLRWLDGREGHGFSAGPGQLLLEGGYRREVDADALAALKAIARRRFLQLMAGRR